MKTLLLISLLVATRGFAEKENSTVSPDLTSSTNAQTKQTLSKNKLRKKVQAASTEAQKKQTAKIEDQ